MGSRRTPVTAASIAARTAVVHMMDRMLQVTGQSLEEAAARAGLSPRTLESWRRPFDQSHRNATQAQLAEFFAANGFRLLQWVEPIDGADGVSEFDGSTLRCGSKPKGGPVETLWLDGVLVGSVAPPLLAAEIVARWERAAARAIRDATGSVGD